MGDGLYAALSGAIGQVTALEVTATNLANASTAGYLSIRPVFHEVLSQVRRGQQPLHFSAVAATPMNTSQRELRQTNRDLDVALPSGAFLAVAAPQGERYSRGGALKVDLSGNLKAPSGDNVLSESGKTIRVEPNAKVSISPTAEVFANGERVARMRMVEFPQPQAIVHEGSTLYNAAAAGAPTTSRKEISVGALEEPSVVSDMSGMMTAQRMYEAFQSAIQTFGEADRKVLGNVAR